MSHSRRVTFAATNDCIKDCQERSLACATDAERDPPAGESRWSYGTHRPDRMRACQDGLTRCVSACDR